LLDGLKAKVTAEGDAEAKAYKEFFAWCDDAAANKGFEIKTATAKKEDLTATIEKSTSDIAEGTSKIAELAASIAKAESELADATGIRNKEKAEFSAAELELVETVDALDRAMAIIGREAAKNPALTQIDTSNMNNVIKRLQSVLDAAAIVTRSCSRDSSRASRERMTRILTSALVPQLLQATSRRGEASWMSWGT